MLKRLVVLVAIVISVIPLCACSANMQGQEQKPQLVIGYGEYRPYIYTNEDGQVAGLDADLAREACKRMGCEPVFKEIKWELRDKYLSSGDVDCLWSCFSMEGREDDYNWAGPYMRSRQAVAVAVDSSVEKLSDLEGKRVGVKISTVPEGLFLKHEGKGFPHVEVLYCLTDAEELAISLRNNYVDAIAGHAEMLVYYLENAQVSYRLLDEEFAGSLVGVAFSRSCNDSLCEELDSALAGMREDGTQQSIMKGYGFDVGRALEGGGIGDEYVSGPYSRRVAVARPRGRRWRHRRSLRGDNRCRLVRLRSNFLLCE